MPTRIASLADFFAEDSDFKVLFFWDWDNGLNPTPYSEAVKCAGNGGRRSVR